MSDFAGKAALVAGSGMGRAAAPLPPRGGARIGPPAGPGGWMAAVRCPALALAWLRARSAAPIPILGARRAAQLRQDPGAVGLAVPAESLARLDVASAIPLDVPSDFHPAGRDAWSGPWPGRLDPRQRPLGRRVLGLSTE